MEINNKNYLEYIKEYGLKYKELRENFEREKLLEVEDLNEKIWEFLCEDNNLNLVRNLESKYREILDEVEIYLNGVEVIWEDF